MEPLREELYTDEEFTNWREQCLLEVYCVRSFDLLTEDRGQLLSDFEMMILSFKCLRSAPNDVNQRRVLRSLVLNSKERYTKALVYFQYGPEAVSVVPTGGYSFLPSSVRKRLGQWRQGGAYENHDASHYY